MKRIEPDDLNTVYFLISVVGSNNYMPRPESSFSLQLGTQLILDYLETMPSLWYSAACVSLQRGVKGL